MTGPKQLQKPFLAVRVREQVNPYNHASIHTDGETSLLDEAVDMADRHRAFDCPRYEDCLMEAAHKMWAGFTCQYCEGRPYGWGSSPLLGP